MNPNGGQGSTGSGPPGTHGTNKDNLCFGGVWGFIEIDTGFWCCMGLKRGLKEMEACTVGAGKNARDLPRISYLLLPTLLLR